MLSPDISLLEIQALPQERTSRLKKKMFKYIFYHLTVAIKCSLLSRFSWGSLPQRTVVVSWPRESEFLIPCCHCIKYSSEREDALRQISGELSFNPTVGKLGLEFQKQRTGQVSQSSCPAHPWGGPEFLNSNSLGLGIPVKPQRGVANHLSLCPSPRFLSNRFSPFHLLQLRQSLYPIPSPSPLLFRNAVAP